MIFVSIRFQTRSDYDVFYLYTIKIPFTTQPNIKGISFTERFEDMFCILWMFWKTFGDTVKNQMNLKITDTYLPIIQLFYTFMRTLLERFISNGRFVF